MDFVACLNLISRHLVNVMKYRTQNFQIHKLCLEVDMDDGNMTSTAMVNSPSLSSSPPSAFPLLDKPKNDVSTPPSSPNVSFNSANAR